MQTTEQYLDNIFQHSLAFINNIDIDETKNRELQNFKSNLNAWGNEYTHIDPVYLSAADFLEPALSLCSGDAHNLLKLFHLNKEHLFWEQSYKKSDSVVSDEMLRDYGFAEIVGKRGPFISDKIRFGIGVWGPNLVYPIHQHQAEEIYVVLSGSAQFTVDSATRKYAANELIWVKSNSPHGFITENEPIVVLYLWQGGDLRQVSSFT